MVPPVAVSCKLLGGWAGLKLPIGHTRLGGLLALLGSAGCTKRPSLGIAIDRGTRNTQMKGNDFHGAPYIQEAGILEFAN